MYDEVFIIPGWLTVTVSWHRTARHFFLKSVSARRTSSICPLRMIQFDFGSKFTSHTVSLICSKSQRSPLQFQYSIHNWFDYLIQLSSLSAICHHGSRGSEGQLTLLSQVEVKECCLIPTFTMHKSSFTVEFVNFPSIKSKLLLLLQYNSCSKACQRQT